MMMTCGTHNDWNGLIMNEKFKSKSFNSTFRKWLKFDKINVFFGASRFYETMISLKVDTNSWAIYSVVFIWNKIKRHRATHKVEYFSSGGASYLKSEKMSSQEARTLQLNFYRQILRRRNSQQYE